MTFKPPTQVVIETPAPVRPDVELPAWVEDLTSLSALDFTVGLGGFSVAAMMPDPVVTIPLALVGMFAFKVLRDTPAGSHARKAVVRTVRSLRAPERKALPGRTRRSLPVGSAPPSPVRRSPKVVVHLPGQTHNPSPRRFAGRSPAVPSAPQRTEEGLVHTRPSSVRGTSPKTWPPGGQSLPRLESIAGEFSRHGTAVVGESGSGKSSTMSRLARHFVSQGDVVLVVAYHYKASDPWPDGVHIVGRGYRRAEGDLAVRLVLLEMVARYRLSADGRLPDLPAIHVFVDEWHAVSAERPDVAAAIVRLINEGRKVGVIALITPHSANVSGVHFEGGTRDNLRFIVMPGRPPQGHETLPRVAEVWRGKPHDKDSELVGKFRVDHPLDGNSLFGIPTGCWALTSLSEAEMTSLFTDASLPVQRKDADAVRDGILAWWRRHSGTTNSGKQPAALPDDAFTRRFGRDTQDAEALAAYLARQGFGVRRISAFLPFRAADAAELARRAVDASQGSSRPSPRSPEETALVLYLLSIGAGTERIARLLDGNTNENIIRIQDIERSLQI